MTDSTPVKVPNEIRVQLQMQAYLDRAIDYYIFARKAVMLGIVPVGGSLFHTAVEMLLHCGLSTKYSQVELEKKFSKHELPHMWTEFKQVFTHARLSKFDKFVNHHRQWKELRYPKSGSGGSAIFFGRTKPDPEIMRQNMANMPKSDIQIEINLEEMDEFMTSVVRIVGVNPDHIKIKLQHKAELLSFYLDENLHPLLDDKKITDSATFLKR